ncbi:MAG: hypothetical protein SFU99_13445, partial [Saprospiraceae bacterium]|nr:hypothetical protein [Saprospiraceae bacterium]
IRWWGVIKSFKDANKNTKQWLYFFFLGLSTGENQSAKIWSLFNTTVPTAKINKSIASPPIRLHFSIKKSD